MPEPIFLLCPACQGAGFAAGVKCSKCARSPIYLWLAGHALYWGRKIDSLEITRRKSRYLFDFLINLILLGFGLIGLGLLVFSLFKNLDGRAVTPFLVFKFLFWQKDAVHFFFWLSIIADLFLGYRMSRAKEKEQTVLVDSLALAENKPADLNYESVLSLNQKNVIEISGAFDNLSLKILEETWALAYKLKQQNIDPLHLLSILISAPESSAILWRLGVNSQLILAKIKSALPWQKQVELENQEPSGRRAETFSLPLFKILLRAYFASYNRLSRQVEIYDLWLALSAEHSLAQEILFDLKIEPQKIANVVKWRQTELQLAQSRRQIKSIGRWRPKGGMNSAMTAIQTKILDRFSQDLTQLAKRGYLHLALGHEKVLAEIFNIIQGAGKSVIVVGEPGIGKESLVNMIAYRMIGENAPEALADKRLVSISVAGIIAGGEPAKAESRLLQVLDEAARSGNVILFIKDIHNLVGNVGVGASSLDVSEVLSQAIEQGILIVIGTTNPRDWSRYLEKSALTNQTVKVNIAEPEGEEAILMLEAEAPFIEGKHKVFFTYDTLAKAVEFSQRYIQIGRLPEKAVNLLAETAALVRKNKGANSLVSGADLAQVISEKINMPIADVSQAESERLLKLEVLIHQRLINQAEAVSAAANALRRARTELRDIKRPIANFLFVGPTGVGKTELAKALAEIYFGSENNMIRLDMSEFQTTESLNRLLGDMANPGILTEQIKKQPYIILLLDEIEKAHQNILNLFLQVMDDGRLSSGDGEVLDCTNLIIIGTSNAASKIIQEKLRAGLKISEIKNNLVNQYLLDYFKPEFLNRFDDIIVFKTLELAEIEQIALLILEKTKKQLALKGIEFQATKEAVAELARLGFDPVYGARPMRRVIQDRVQDALAIHLLRGQIDRRDKVILEVGGQVKIEKAIKF